MGIPFYGTATMVAATVDDLADWFDTFYKENKNSIASRQAKVGLDAFISSRGWTKDKLEDNIKNINRDIDRIPVRIKEARGKRDKEKQDKLYVFSSLQPTSVGAFRDVS